jgi:hypothetical protein
VHEGFAEDALNSNAMNVNPGGKQKKMQDTIIPLNNPDPVPGEEDMCGQIQHMCFPDDHEDPKLRGQQKGFRVILMEQKSVWDKYTAICKAHSMKIVGKCGSCTKSQVHKDTERCVAQVEEMGPQEDTIPMDEKTVLETAAPPAAVDEWCCMYRVLSLQEDFLTEKPLIQSAIKKAGHVCLFLLRFHCELNPIEMLWGYGKYRASISCISCASHAYLRSLRISECC